jgi:hypothetical protein
MAMMMPVLGTMLKPMADNINQVALDVEAGKYNSINDVQAALQKGMPQIPGQSGNPKVAGNTPPPAQQQQPPPPQEQPKQQGRDVINNPANLPGVQ